MVVLITITLVFAVFLVAVQAARAGSPDDPEIDDGADVAAATAVDVLRAWVEEEASGEAVLLHVDVEDLSAGPAPLTVHTYTWSFQMVPADDSPATAGSWQVTATVRTAASGTDVDYALRTGEGTRVATLAGTYDTEAGHLAWTVPRRLIGRPAAGDLLADPHVVAEAARDDSDVVLAVDRAPDACCGRDYTFTVGTAGSGTGGGSGTGTGGGTGTTGGDGSGTDGGDGGSGAPASLLAGTVALVAMGALMAYALHARRGGVALVCPEPRQTAHPGQGTNFPLRVENRSKRPVTVDLRTEDVPDGWVAFVPLPELDLEAGQARELWVTLKAPADASAGDRADVGVTAMHRDDRRKRSEVSLTARVEAKPVAGPRA